jgi:hypothetical protein
MDLAGGRRGCAVWRADTVSTMLLFRLPLILLEVLLREGAGVLGRLVGLVRSGDEGSVTVTPAAPAPAPSPRPGPPPPTADEAIARRRAREAAAAPPPPPPPAAASDAHVDREATVVESSGPAEDVHATLHVDRPWDGYDDQSASEIVSRLREADEATKAVVRLYEQQHKNRRTVLRATE